jgi:hypothetical protein
MARGVLFAALMGSFRPGGLEPDHVSPMGALMHGLLSPPQPTNMEGGGMMPPNPSGPPGPYGLGHEMPHDTSRRAAQAAPNWMDVTPPQPQARTGVTATKNSGLHTLGFFAAIIFVVGAAGFLGIAVWGPEKTVTSRSRLATDPPPPMTLPSLPPTASAEPSVPAVAPAESAATPTETARKKKSVRGGKKSH